MRNVGNLKEKVIENYKQYIAPQYPNGNGDLKAVLVKIIPLPFRKKFTYGIRFEKNPIIGNVSKGEGNVEIEIMEVL